MRYSGSHARGGRKFVLSAALAVTALVASACGTSSATTGSSSSNSIRVIFTGLAPEQTPFFAAVQQGYFKAAGLNVTYGTISGGDTAVQAAMVQGSVDVVTGGAIEWITDLSHKAISGKIVGEITDQNYDILARPGITSVSQLKGKKIGISGPGGGDDVYMKAVLSKYGIGLTDASYLTVGNPTSRLAALESGNIDATEIPITDLPANTKPNVILGATQSPVTLVSLSMFATQKFLSSNAANLAKFTAAIGKGAEWVRANPTAAVKACEASGSTASQCTASIARMTDSSQTDKWTWSSTSAVNVAGIQSTIDAAVEAYPAVKGMSAASIVDTSIAGTTP